MSSLGTHKTSENQFYELQPEDILNAVESIGFRCTGHFYQLNSYENRVFDVLIEPQNQFDLPQDRIVIKFYRPGRWSLESIQEEHQFIDDLVAEGIPAVQALDFGNKTFVQTQNGLHYTLFPKKLGRLPDEILPKDLTQIGRTLAKIHNVGAKSRFTQRPTLGDETHPGWKAQEIIEPWIEAGLETRYLQACDQILDYLEDHMDAPENYKRIHGDLHRGNLLLTDGTSDQGNYFLVDFDDSLNGPAIQDLWMLLSGDPEELKSEMDQFLKGYESLRLFDDSQIELINALRGLRIFSYGAWIAQRWQDPFFKKIFPQFTTYNYWAEETEALERIAWQL